MAELIDNRDEFERERARLTRIGATVALDVDELDVRRAVVLDAGSVEPAGHVARLARKLGVTEDELRGWLVVNDQR